MSRKTKSEHNAFAIDGAGLLRIARGLTNQSQAELALVADVDQGRISRFESGRHDTGLRAISELLQACGMAARIELVALPERSLGRDVCEDQVLHEWARMHYEFEAFMPPALWAKDWHWFEGDTPHGPTLQTALYFRDRLSVPIALARQPEALLQEAFRMGYNDRDNELIHSLLHCGAGSAHGQGVLDHFLPCDTANAGERTVRLGGRAWAHVIAAVDADAKMCRQRADYLQRCLDAAAKRRLAKTRVENAEQNHNINLEMTERDSRGRTTETTSAMLTEAVSAVKEIDAELDQLSRCNPEVIGTAGERILHPMLISAAVVLEEVAQEMRTCTGV